MIQIAVTGSSSLKWRTPQGRTNMMHVRSVCPSAARIHVALFILMALLTFGCGISLSVKTQRDSSIALLPGVTWAWNPTPAQRLPEEADLLVDDPVIHVRLQDAVETVMGSKGFLHVEPAAAELLVNYRVGLISEREWQQVFLEGLEIRHPSETSMDHMKGFLLIDFLERSTGKLAFRSWAVGDVTRGDASDFASYATVTRLLEDLP